MYKPKKCIARAKVLLLLLCIMVAAVIAISAFIVVGALTIFGALCIAGLAVLIGFPTLILGGLIALVWLCIERGELPWHVFGKSAMEGEYEKGNHAAVPTIRWTDRSFRNQREGNSSRQESNEGAARATEEAT